MNRHAYLVLIPLCGSETARPLNMYERRIASVLSVAGRPRNSRARQTSTSSPAQLSNTRANFVTDSTDCETAIPSWFLCPLFAGLFDTEINKKKVPFFTVEERSDRPSARRQSGVGSARRRASASSSRRRPLSLRCYSSKLSLSRCMK